MHISRIPLRKINNIKMLINPLPGSEIGIPLFFLEKTFTNLHYGVDINTKELLIQCFWRINCFVVFISMQLDFNRRLLKKH